MVDETEKASPGIRPPRKTLRQAMAEVALGAAIAGKATDILGPDFPVLAVEALSQGSDVRAAGALYGVVNENATSIDAETRGARSPIENFSHALNEGTHDLSLPARLTLYDQTKSRTEINRHSITGQAGDNTSGRRGEPIPSEPKNDQFEYVRDVVGKNSPDAASAFKHSSQGGFFTAEQILELIDKIGSAAGISGHDLLADVAGWSEGRGTGLGLTSTFERERPGAYVPPEDAHKYAIAASTHDNLAKVNRYSPSDMTPFIGNNGSSDEKEFFSHGLYSIQTGPGTLGVYHAHEGDSTESSAPQAGKPIHTVDLRVMAMQMMLRAEGSIVADMNEEFAKFASGEFTMIADLAALYPEATQMGSSKIGSNIVRIRRTAKAEELSLNTSLGNDEIFPILTSPDASSKTDGIGLAGGNITPKGAGSYGTMNTFLEPFDGVMPMGMLFIALYGLVGTAVIGSLVPFSNFAPQRQGKADSSNPFDLPLGRRGNAASSFMEAFMETIGWQPTDRDPASCILSGLERFYGVPNITDMIIGAASPMSLIDVAFNLILAPGYYATITKQVLRDMEQINEMFSGWQLNMGILHYLGAVFKSTEVFVSSTLFRFTQVMAVVGDIDLGSREEFGVKSTGENVLPVNRKDLNVPPTPHGRMRVSRFTKLNSNSDLIGVVNPLSLHTFPSILNSSLETTRLAGLSMLAHSVDNGTAADKSFKDKDELRKEFITGQQKMLIRQQNKLANREEIEAIEEALDLEYMPFYVHDLRTDEIISMPAFITSFSEEFSPEYATTHGYGRTDPVYTYSSTTRSISLSFKLIAMGSEDFDYMWFIINRLIAMCYPSRSPGQIRTWGDGKQRFVQPFSQVPAASPMIRLRLGETLHTNYSRAGLARLFGLLGGGANLDSAKEASETAEKHQKNKAYAMALAQEMHRQKREELFTDGAKNDIILLPGCRVRVSQYVHAGADMTIDTSVVFPITVKDMKAVVAAVPPGKPGMSIPTIPKEPLRNGRERRKIVARLKGTLTAGDVEKLGFYSAALIKTIVDGKPGAMSLGAKDIEVIVETANNYSKIDHRSFEEAAKSKIKDLHPEGDRLSDEDLKKESDFINSPKNPIVKSFESARGKGLAGFITSLGLEYDESTWEIDIGRRGPKTVGISLGFSPVHDLPLGLDHAGELIAPSHPVGAAVSVDPYATFDAKADKSSFVDKANAPSNKKGDPLGRVEDRAAYNRAVAREDHF